MATDDERPSGTGLREAIHEFFYREHFGTDPTPEDLSRPGRAFYMDPDSDWGQKAGRLADLLAAHPDAAAGTTVEEWGFQWPEGVYHEGDGIYAYPNPGTEETAAARKTHRAMGAAIYRRTRIVVPDEVSEWEEVDE